VKNKALLQLIEDVITQGTQALILQENEKGDIEDLILNISIEDLMDDVRSKKPTWYPKVMDFLKKVKFVLYICKIIFELNDMTIM